MLQQSRNAKNPAFLPRILTVFIAVLFSVQGCGGGDGGPSGSGSIGPSGGSITSSDGKVTLTIPAGALTQTINVSITKVDDGASPDPDYVANTTYKLTSPSVTLSAPATLKYDLKDAILTKVVTGLRVASAQLVGACDATSPSCYVVLGSGPCPDDHNKLAGLVSTSNGTSAQPVWTQQCDLSPPAQPLLATLDPTTVIGGSYDQSTNALSGSLAALATATFATVDTKLYLTITGGELQPAVDGTTFGKTNEVAVPMTVTPSHAAAIAQYKFTFDGGFGINKDGSPIDTLQLPGVFLGQNTTGTFSQKFGSLLNPGATYAYLFFQAHALDAAGNELAESIEVVPVTYGTQLQVVLVADPISITAPGRSNLVADVPNSLLGTGIQKMEFFEGATKVGEVDEPRYLLGIDYTQANNGTHTYTAKVTDQQSKTAISNPVTVTVAINVAPTFTVYVDPVNGSNTNAGKLAAPFKTIAYAGTKVTSGQSIGLLDGTYLEGTVLGSCDGRNITVPAGITVQSVHPRAAVIANVTLGSAGSATFTDLALDGGATNGGCTGIAGTTGTMTLSGITFNDGAHLVLSGTVVATLAPGSLSGNYNGGVNYEIAQLTNSAQLTIHGGTFDGGPTASQCGTAQFVTDTTASIVFDGVTVQNFPGVVVSASGGSVTMQNNTVFDHDGYLNCGAVAVIGGVTTFAMNNSTLKNATTSRAFDVRGGTETINIVGSTISGNLRGFYHDTNFGDCTTNLTITSSTISGTTSDAFNWSTGLNPGLTLTVRNSQVTGNATGFIINAGTGSSVDLGTSASLGGNTIQNTGVGLQLVGAGLTANAAGNTWVVSAEGADAAGHYAAALVPGQIASGINYQIASGSAIQF